MAAEGKKQASAQIERLQTRIGLADGAANPATLQNQVAAAQAAPRQSVPLHIDLDQLQEAGIPTPNGGRSRVIDEYRLIKRAVMRIAAGGSNLNLVLVTSAQPGEGKTFTALSLAMSAVADHGVPVLLVDVDVIKQDSCRRLGIRSEIGLLDVLEDRFTLPQVIVHTDVPRLAVLPAGRDRPLAHELMAGAEMQAVMQQLSNAYRKGLVILDIAPALVTADASVLSANVGQIVLVIEANRTGRAAVEQTVSVLQGCERISLLLNKCDAAELVNQYGTYYGDYGQPYRYPEPGEAPSLVDRVASHLGSQLGRSNKMGPSQ
jgi:receptor protein-tyrosine kinase